VGVIAPGAPADPEPLETGIRRIRERGFDVRKADNLLTRTGFTAGDESTRREACLHMMTAPDVDALFCARGGQGAIHLLSSLCRDLENAPPKWLVGYSDVTALQLAMLKGPGWLSLSGPMVATELGNNTLSTSAEDQLWHTLTTPMDDWRWNLKEDHTPDVWSSGSASGPLIGGCLSLVCALIGTPYMPDLSGRLLLLEDVDEAPYRIDRMCYQLRYAGVFDQINGLLLGHFPGCDGSDQTGSLREVLRTAARAVDGPVLANVPYGHRTEHVQTMPIGAELRLETAPPSLTAAV